MPALSIAFLPGASGSGAFWRPVADRLPGERAHRLWDWPGAGEQPADPAVRGYADLISLVAAGTDRATDVVAQSMGGVVAIGLALAHPTMVRRLVLVATSGGLRIPGLATPDWRAAYRAAFPGAQPWVTGDAPDFGEAIDRITVPTLLIWGDADPISPVRVGEHLQRRLPDSRLHVLAGGTHSLASERADEVAPLIADHLAAGAMPSG